MFPLEASSNTDYSLLLALTESGIFSDIEKELGSLQSWKELVDLLNTSADNLFKGDLSLSDMEEGMVMTRFRLEDFDVLPSYDDITSFRLYGLQSGEGTYQLAELSADRIGQSFSAAVFSSEDANAETEAVADEIWKLFES